MQRSRARRTGAACAIVLGAGSVLGLASPSLGDPGQAKPAPDAIVAEVQAELAESSEAMVRAASALRRAQAALPHARKRAADARRQLVQARAREEAAAEGRRTAQAELLAATEGAEASARRVDEQRAQLGRVARAAYQQGGGGIGSVAVLFEADSPGDLTERLVAFDQVVSTQRAALTELKAGERRTKNLTLAFERVRDQLAAKHQRAEAEAETVAALVVTAETAELEVQRLVRAQEAALAAAEAARAEDERRLLELQGESDRLTKLLAQQAQALLGGGLRAGVKHPVQPGVITSPVKGSVTSPFGMRVHPVTGVYKLHSGTDFGVSCGSPITAARGGSVIAAGFNRAYGWRTVISHGVVGGAVLTTTYNHQSAVGVRVGQVVKVGDLIGAVGTTGYSTGCHLHFELIINGDVVDPMPWLASG